MTFGGRYPGTPTWRFLQCPLYGTLSNVNNFVINVERAPDRSYRKKVKGSEVLMQRRFSRIV